MIKELFENYENYFVLTKWTDGIGFDRLGSYINIVAIPSISKESNEINFTIVAIEDNDIIIANLLKNWKCNNCDENKEDFLEIIESKYVLKLETGIDIKDVKKKIFDFYELEKYRLITNWKIERM